MYYALMTRYGDVDSHRYLLGPFDTLELAAKAGALEDLYRGGKYEGRLVECLSRGEEIPQCMEAEIRVLYGDINADFSIGHRSQALLQEYERSR